MKIPEGLPLSYQPEGSYNQEKDEFTLEYFSVMNNQGVCVMQMQFDAEFVTIACNSYQAQQEAMKKARKVLYDIRIDEWPGLAAVAEALDALEKVGVK